MHYRNIHTMISTLFPPIKGHPDDRGLSEGLHETINTGRMNSVDPFDGAKPRLLRRGMKAPLRVNPEQASRIHAGGVEGLTFHS